MKKLINFLLFLVFPIALATLIVILARLLTVEEELFDESEIFS